MYNFDYYHEETDKDYTVIVKNKVIFDKHYGQDADGNRSTPIYFVEFKSLQVFDGPLEIKDKLINLAALNYYVKHKMKDAEVQEVEELL